MEQFWYRGFGRYGMSHDGSGVSHFAYDFPSEIECSIPKSWTIDGREPNILMVILLLHNSFKIPEKRWKGRHSFSWYDGGILPALPDEILPGEPFGNSDGGILFIGTKGKLLFDCYGAKPQIITH